MQVVGWDVFDFACARSHCGTTRSDAAISPVVQGLRSRIDDVFLDELLARALYSTPHCRRGRVFVVQSTTAAARRVNCRSSKRRRLPNSRLRDVLGSVELYEVHSLFTIALCHAEHYRTMVLECRPALRPPPTAWTVWRFPFPAKYNFPETWWFSLGREVDRLWLVSPEPRWPCPKSYLSWFDGESNNSPAKPTASLATVQDQMTTRRAGAAPLISRLVQCSIMSFDEFMSCDRVPVGILLQQMSCGGGLVTVQESG